jgi:hypothetical protein
METQLRHYLAGGRFEPFELTISPNLDTPHAFVTRDLTSTEVCYRLGDELLHIGRPEAAESYFLRAKKLAPGSPCPTKDWGCSPPGAGNPRWPCASSARR